MLNHLLHRLACLVNRPPPAPPAAAWSWEDCSWYTSSFDLARGLEVTEYRGASAPAFSDTLPAFHPPRA